MKNENYNPEKLAMVAMQIILKAGDGRIAIEEALTAAKNKDFEAADNKIAEAKECNRLAHIAQTEVISAETSGEVSIQPTLLFIHAQDTMMNVDTEIRLIEEMVSILRMKGD